MQGLGFRLRSGSNVAGQSLERAKGSHMCGISRIVDDFCAACRDRTIPCDRARDHSNVQGAAGERTASAHIPRPARLARRHGRWVHGSASVFFF